MDWHWRLEEGNSFNEDQSGENGLELIIEINEGRAIKKNLFLLLKNEMAQFNDTKDHAILNK
jgi:hypothetical protein